MTTLTSRAIAQICDFYPKNDEHILFENDCRNFKPIDYSGLQYGSIVYVPTSCLGIWIKHMLKHIRDSEIKIILVTGGSVFGAPREVSTIFKMDVYNILQPILLAWFTQNLDVPTIGMYPIPLGLDFHHLVKPWEQRNFFKWLGPERSISNQNKDLIDTQNRALPWKDRLDKAYCFFQFQLFERHGRDRYVAQEELPPDNEMMVYAEKRHERIETWNEMIKYKYIISPHGNGLDCYRTWESIELGCIPVVKKSSLSESGLYTKLPVLVLDSWRDFLDPAIRQEKVDKIQMYINNPPKKTLEYWIGRLEQSRYK